MIGLIWSKLSGKEKGALIIFLGMFTYIMYQSARIAYKDHLLIKRISDDIEVVTKKQEENTKKTDSLLLTGKKINTKAIKRKKSIDKKLYDDKKLIDNTVYPISKIDSLLASRGN